MRAGEAILLSSVLILLSGVGGEASGAPGAGADGFARVEGRRLVAADGRPLALRGIGLGNWLLPEGYMWKLENATAHWQIRQLVKELVGPTEARRFWRHWYETFMTRDDIRAIRAAGFDSIRVPFNYDLFTPEDHPGLWTGPGFEMLDRVIRWSREENLLVVLDMHAAPCGQTGTNIDNSVGHPWLFEDRECQDRTVEVWSRIAERYRDETTVLGYDLLNEPIPHYAGYERFTPALEPLYRRLVAAIRTVDPNHVIFLGGARWNTDFSVFGPPFAPNLVYTFHKYWMDPVQEEIQEYVDFRGRHGVPVWMGESGENDDEWIEAYRRLLEGNEIGWAFWTYKRMDTTRSVRSFERPPHWDEVAAYALARGVAPDKLKEHRPPLDHARRALEGLIENVRFDNTWENAGYLRALGLMPGASAAGIDPPAKASDGE